MTFAKQPRLLIERAAVAKAVTLSLLLQHQGEQRSEPEWYDDGHRALLGEERADICDGSGRRWQRHSNMQAGGECNGYTQRGMFLRCR